MANKNLVSNTTTKVNVRKDLFGAHEIERKDDIINIPDENSNSALQSIWGESNSSTSSQPSSNSLLLSPALKRSPNRFNTSPGLKKSPETPKKKASTPRKLSKYSPFRKKVYNPNPKGSIKNFFQVKECNTGEDVWSQTKQTSLDIICLTDKKTSSDTNCVIASSTATSSQTCNEINSEESCKISKSTLNSEIIINEVQKENTPNVTPKKTPLSTPIKSNVSTPQSGKKNLSPTSKITNSKDVYGSFMLTIVLNAMINDLDPNGVKLFDEEDYEYINLFKKFDQPSQRLYGRLLNRTIDWKRTANMKYGDVTLQLLLLEQSGFITTDCSSENLEILLNLLTIPELKQLCKFYKLPESGVKSEIISRLISRAKQPSIKSFFAKTSSDSTGESNFRAKIYELLGVVIKVTSGPHKTLCRCLLFFSYPHYRGSERDRFSDQLALVGQIQNLTFPAYVINRTNVFLTREHFLSYEAALLDSSKLLEAKEDKQWESALEKLRDVVKKLEHYLASEEIRTEVEVMPEFLRKFTAGGCYVRALSSSIDVFKKWDHTLVEAEVCLKLLLKQRLFSRNRRGHWYEQLALLYQHNMKDNVKASQMVLRGLRDEYIDVISRYILCARAALLEGRKKDGINDYMKDTLAKQRGLVEPLEEPTSVTITEQVFNGPSKKGLKRVYIQDSEDGKMLSSVEEVALEHFRQQGYFYGAHDEGGIIKSVIFACFWNEIYDDIVIDGHGLFHSEYQTVPLDWNSEMFYDRRREKLKKKLQDIAEGGVETVIKNLKDTYVNNINTESIVIWRYFENLDLIESLIRCIEIDVFLNLSRLLLRYHRIYGAGFPDLTLWDPVDKKCLFVEVKSPNDVLSMKQRVWLHSLTKMGAQALVCHVQSVGCKSQKRKASSSVDS